MLPPKPLSLSIIILTLLSATALAWSSIAAPCIEIGFFWASVVTALSAALYAWTNSDRISQSTMLVVYCLLACSITLAVASVVDLANVTILGRYHDAHTGLLLGGLIAFVAIASIAVRCSKRFPTSMVCIAFVSFGIASLYVPLFSSSIKPEYTHIVTLSVLAVGAVSFILLYLCKQNLSAGQYISTLSIVSLFVYSCISSAKDNFIAGALVFLLVLLACALIFIEWRKAFSNISVVKLPHIAKILFVAAGVAIVLIVPLSCFTLSANMLIRNHSPVRYIAKLKDTVLWPGDAAFVRLVMQQGSLWAEEVGNDPPEHQSINQYLDAIRPGEDRFSIVFDNKDDSNDAMGFDADGIGIKWSASKGSLSLTRVNSASSAGKIGLARGDRIEKINGIRVSDLKADTDLNNLFGECKIGDKVSLNLLTSSGKSRTVSMPVTVNPQDPPKSRIISTQNGNNVGYLYLDSFTDFQFKDITEHFETFKNAGIHDLVLDLRYNSGGKIIKTVMLASLIGGEAVSGKLFINYERTQRYEDNKSEYLFESIPESIQAHRLVVLTTDDTCSASEAIINGLRPYIPVYTVGSTTCGKPFGMDLVEFGDKTLANVSARLLNSRGEGHYTSGIRADFKVKDDLNHQLGDPQEAMLKKALEVLRVDTHRM